VARLPVLFRRQHEAQQQKNKQAGMISALEKMQRSGRMTASSE